MRKKNLEQLHASDIGWEVSLPEMLKVCLCGQGLRVLEWRLSKKKLRTFFLKKKKTRLTYRLRTLGP